MQEHIRYLTQEKIWALWGIRGGGYFSRASEKVSSLTSEIPALLYPICVYSAGGRPNKKKWGGLLRCAGHRDLDVRTRGAWRGGFGEESGARILLHCGTVEWLAHCFERVEVEERGATDSFFQVHAERSKVAAAGRGRPITKGASARHAALTIRALLLL